MRIRMPHPVWLAVFNAEIAWARDEMQATTRTRLVVGILERDGLISPGEWLGGVYCQTPAAPAQA